MEENNGGGLPFGILVFNTYLYLKCSKSMCNNYPEIGLPLIGCLHWVPSKANTSRASVQITHLGDVLSR